MDHDEARGPGDSPGSIEEPCVERQGERATCRGISKEAIKGGGNWHPGLPKRIC